MADEGSLSPKDKLSQIHKKETKELQAKIQKLKHAVPKGDKKRKKEVTLQIAQLEQELEERHNAEMQQLEKSNQETTLSEELAATSLTETEEEKDAVPSSDQSHLPAPKKPSKAQKRRDRKEQQGREREEQIKQQEVLNLTGNRHVEAQKLKALLSARNLGIYEIPSDGNCLYAAIADQLHRLGEAQTTVSVLRTQAAEFMRQNPDDFLPFLSKPDTGGLFTMNEYSEYCDRLQNTAEWGGQIELQALSNILKKPIDIIQADSPVITIGEQYPNPNLLLSYHRHAYGSGEHYNSVVSKDLLPKDDEDVDEFT